MAWCSHLTNLLPWSILPLVWTGLDLGVLGCAGLYWAMVGCIGLCWAVLGCAGPYWAYEAVLYYGLEMFM